MGSLFTETNGFAANQVVAFDRFSEGTSAEAGRIDTGGVGAPSPFRCGLPPTAPPCPIVPSQGVTVAMGTCHAHGGLGDPYLPFREILAALVGGPAGVQADLSKGGRVRRAGRSAGRVAVDIAPDLVELLIAGVPGLGIAVQAGTIVGAPDRWWPAAAIAGSRAGAGGQDARRSDQPVRSGDRHAGAAG